MGGRVTVGASDVRRAAERLLLDGKQEPGSEGFPPESSMRVVELVVVVRGGGCRVSLRRAQDQRYWNGAGWPLSSVALSGSSARACSTSC